MKKLTLSFIIFVLSVPAAYAVEGVYKGKSFDGTQCLLEVKDGMINYLSNSLALTFDQDIDVQEFYVYARQSATEGSIATSKKTEDAFMIITLKEETADDVFIFAKSVTHSVWDSQSPRREELLDFCANLERQYME